MDFETNKLYLTDLTELSSPLSLTTQFDHSDQPLNSTKIELSG